MKNKKLNLQKSGKIAIRNDGIIVKQTPMTIQEARLLRLVIMQVSQFDDDLMEYETTIPELAEFLGINSTQTLYDDMYEICDRLSSQKVNVKTDSTKENWAFRPWMGLAEYNDGKIKLALNKYVKHYVMELNELFTQYEMNDVLQLRSYYSLRIYEILKMKYTSCRKKKHTFDFTIEELREMTSTEDKFKQIGIWKLRVIDIAVREINEKTDINITAEMLKCSRKYIGISFVVTEKSKIKSIEAPDPEHPEPAAPTDPIPGQVDLADIYKVKELLDYKAIPCTIEQAEQLFLAYNSEISEQFLNNLDYVSKNKKIRNHVAYLLKISKDHVAQEPETIPTDSPEPKRKPRKTKVETIEPMSESREQAYRDMEVDFAEDLWPDLAVEE
jgi:plasmid replication initiation protein